MGLPWGGEVAVLSADKRSPDDPRYWKGLERYTHRAANQRTKQILRRFGHFDAHTHRVERRNVAQSGGSR
jgi:hypothetical protein